MRTVGRTGSGGMGTQPQSRCGNLRIDTRARAGSVETTRDRCHARRDDSHVSGILQKAIAEGHHLEDVALEGYEPATIGIVLVAIVLALTVVVGIALGVTLTVYYLS